MIKSSVPLSIADLIHRLSTKMTDHKQSALDFETEDFEAIEQAVLETERGRWFLAEYAARNRRSETTSLLTSLTKLEKAIGRELQYINNTTEGYQSPQRLAHELDTLINAIGYTENSDQGPVESLAHQMASNSFTLARLADTIRDRVDELNLIDLPADAAINLGQATQQIIILTAQQNQLSRQVAALAKIIAYLRDRLESLDPSNGRTEPENFSTALSIASLNKLREQVAALDKGD
jgi:chromosome segregation ATPase